MSGVERGNTTAYGGKSVKDDGTVSASLRKREILKERARFYAMERELREDSVHKRELLVFSLAYERYAVDTSSVREVLPLKSLTFLPGVPEFIMGIIHVRGQILSVIDLRKLFNITERGITEFNKIIILTHDDMELGILADEIEGIVSVQISQVHAIPPTMKGVNADFLSGVAVGNIIVLNSEAILGSEAIKAGSDEPL